MNWVWLLYGYVCRLPFWVFLYYRLCRGLEARPRIQERRGYSTRARPNGFLVWIHAVSLGETLSVLPLVERIEAPIVMTTATRSAAHLILRRFPDRCIHQYVPFDHPRWVSRFLAFWKPSVFILVETDLWPNTIRATTAHKIPSAFINIRISRRTLKFWKILPFSSLLSCFSMCSAQEESTAKILESFGAKVAVVGNLKYDVRPKTVAKKDFASLQKTTVRRVVWVAASTHRGEEEVVAQIHTQLRPKIKTLLTILVPRHPERVPDLVPKLKKINLEVVCRTDGLPKKNTDVYLVDTFGELDLFYRVCLVVFMGGSLVPHGGQNPLEAARQGCALLSGTHVWNFAKDYRRLGVELVKDQDGLKKALFDLLQNPDKARERGNAAQKALHSGKGTTQRVVDALLSSKAFESASKSVFFENA